MNKLIPIQKPEYGRSLVFAMILLMAALTTVPVIGDGRQDAERLTGVKCVVDGSQPCREVFSLGYLEGRIYFHRPGALAVFQRQALDAHHQPRPDSWLVCRANHQLLTTGQYRQFRCPLTGQPIDPKFLIRVAGIEVGFHDQVGYQQVLKQTSLAARAQLLFAPAPFARGFKSVSRPVSSDLSMQTSDPAKR